MQPRKLVLLTLSTALSQEGAPGMIGTGSPLPECCCLGGAGGGKSYFTEDGARKFGGVGFSPVTSTYLKQQHVDERP